MNILITRPLMDAEDLMENFFAYGHKIIHLPTLKIFGIETELVNPDTFDAFVFTSANAVRNLKLTNTNKNVLVRNMRANIDTRIKKLKDGLYDGIVLALAGIETLKLEKNVKHIFTAEEMLPAVGQGIIAAQCRKDDTNIIELLKKINNKETKQCAIAERSLLKTLGGDCDTAVGGLAIIENNELILSAQLFSDSGEQNFIYKTKGKRQDGVRIGALAGTELLKKAGNSFKKK